MKQYIGKKYGKLTVVSEVEKQGKHRRFLCKCDCGNGGIFNYRQFFNVYPECKECYKKRVQQKKEKSKEKIDKARRKPIYHSCGKLIKDHLRCERCGIILCDTTDKGNGIYCTDCFTYLKNNGII